MEELKSSNSKAISLKMMAKSKQQSLDKQPPEQQLRPDDDEEEEDFNVEDANEDYDCKVPPMFL